MKMRNGELRIEHIKWLTLTTLAIVVVVVDATAYVDFAKGKSVIQTAQEYKKDFEEKVTYKGDQVWRVHKHNDSINDLIKKYNEVAYSIWSNQPSSVDIFIRNRMIGNVISIFRNRVNYNVLIDDVQKAIEKENAPLTAEMQVDLEGRKGHRMEWSSYHGVKDIHDYLDYLADTYPEVCSVQTIGRSIEGRPLKLLRISNGKPKAPAMWIDGGIHAREWISPAVVTYIIEHLVENSERLSVDYYILAVVNPDGYEYTSIDRLWRKNRRKSRSNCAGVDLNRNFGYHWGEEGTSDNICHSTYRGEKPFSEPESDAIRNFFENSNARFKAYVSFHSYGQYILYPWGYAKRLPPDYQDIDRIGRQAAEAMKKQGGENTVYTVGNSASTLYPAAGGSDDWAKAVVKVKYSYTIELRDTGKYGFILPSNRIVPTAKEAFAAINVITDAIKTL